MRKETKILMSLLFLPPALGELLSGSTPPLGFFNPIGLLILVLFYGCGTLLIREAKARWKLQWSVIFLAVTYGVVEEGLMMQSFFNPGHEDLGALSRYGMLFGVQWPWTIMLIFYHATISTLIPIAIVELLWPKHEDVPLLKKRGLMLTFAGFSLVTILLMVSIWIKEKTIPYHPDPVLLIGSFIVAVLSSSLAYKFKNSRISTKKTFLFPPFVFAVIGFLFQAFNLFTPNALAEAKVSATTTLIVQFVGTASALLFVFYQICHQNRTKRHMVSLIFGSTLFYILLTPVHEFAEGVNPDPTKGMLVVGIISLILLIIWRRTVLKNEGS